MQKKKEAFSLTVLPFFLFLVFLAGPLPAYSASGTGVQDELSKISEGPAFSQAEVQGWVSVAANDIFNFTYEDYKGKLEGARPYFSLAGFRSFYGAMNESGFLKSIISKQQSLRGYIISPVALSEPKILRKTFFWTATFNFVIEYDSPDNHLYQFLKISVDVKELPDGDEGKSKLAIDRWVSYADEHPVFCPCDDSTKKRDKANLHDELKSKMGIEDEEGDADSGTADQEDSDPDPSDE
ncbi:MAG: DotI/IcmL family type IV secretion protein [Alphaproteobacteria bacterium]|nr:DotI/IcmL family type IV secretion protein [Alphaproteobacteria bacterium]MCB1840826.1 DotI/IcmL family type IV secretion protein [Alphaproteobacteria bacterium]